jgi:hypothetical protein
VGHGRSPDDQNGFIAVVEVLGDGGPRRERGDAVEEDFGADLAGTIGMVRAPPTRARGVISAGRRIAAVRPSRSWADFSVKAVSVMFISLRFR